MTRTLDRQTLLELSKKYHSRTEFKNNDPSAYVTAVKTGVIGEMDWLMPKRMSWTPESISAEAHKYCTLSEFRYGSRNAYEAARRSGLLGKLTWLERGLTIWDDDSVMTESRKYKSRLDFYNGCKAAYRYAVRNSLLDKMPWLEKRLLSWTDDMALNESRKYGTRTGFQYGCPSAYNYALRNGLLDSMSWLSRKESPVTGRVYFVYAYIDEGNKKVYVGLTCRPEQRRAEHIADSRSSVNSYFKSICSNVPEPVYLERNVNMKEALEKEDWYIHYFSNHGYTPINRAKTGVGSGSVGNITKKYMTLE